MRHRWLTLILLMLVAVSAGCRGQTSRKPPIHPNPNMDDQFRFDPQERTSFYPDNRVMRYPVAGTVARGSLQLDTVYYEGQNPDGSWVQMNPRSINYDVLKRGQERYDIYCAVCHDRVGTGRGLAITYPTGPGFVPPPSFHEQRLREMPDGQIFNSITHGVRTMPSYRHQIDPDDRWAIVAYLRALQRSQRTTVEDVPREILETLEERQ